MLLIDVMGPPTKLRIGMRSKKTDLNWRSPLRKRGYDWTVVTLKKKKKKRWWWWWWYRQLH